MMIESIRVNEEKVQCDFRSKVVTLMIIVIIQDLYMLWNEVKTVQLCYLVTIACIVLYYTALFCHTTVILHDALQYFSELINTCYTEESQ